MARGNASINNLLATAQAARDKQLAYNDQAASYDWNLSAKTIDDFNKYKDYLSKRQGETTDPSKQLTAQQKIVDAQRTYTSAEVGRQTISVLYGDQSNTDKYAKINSLMEQAAQSGDASLFQSLDETRARLSKTIQDEQQAASDRAASNARGAADRSSAAYSKGLSAQIADHDAGIRMLKDSYQQGKPLTMPNPAAPNDQSKNIPITVKYANNKPVTDDQGHFVPDPNGQPLILDARTYAALHGAALTAKAQSLQQAIDSGNDPNDKHYDDLQKLTTSEDYQKFASPEAWARTNSNSNPYITKIDKNTGKRTFDIAETAPVTRINPDTGKMETVNLPREGDVGKQFVINSITGSSSSNTYDRTSSEKQNVDLGTGKVPTAFDGGQKGGDVTIGGYGKQQFITNPNKAPLPNGKARAENLYIAPDSSGIHSVAPLKVIGKDKDGKPMYGTAAKGDIPLAPVPFDAGQIGANFKNDYTDAAHAVGNTFGALTRGVSDVGNNVLHTGENMVGGAADALSGAFKQFDYGQKQKADRAAQVAAAQKAATLAAIQSHNDQMAAASAAAQRQNQAAAAAAARPGAPAPRPTVPAAGYASNSFQSPAQNFNAGMKAGGGILGGLQTAGLVPVVKPWYQL